jgi:acyl carrier protein
VNETEARTVIVEALHKTANVFSNPSISERLQSPSGEVRFEELGLDSLDITEWCIEIEARTGLTLDPAEIAGAKTIGDVAKLVAAKMAGIEQPTA